MFNRALKNICVISVDFMLTRKPYRLLQIYFYNFQKDFLINFDGFNGLFQSNARTLQHCRKSVANFPINGRGRNNGRVSR